VSVRVQKRGGLHKCRNVAVCIKVGEGSGGRGGKGTREGERGGSWLQKSNDESVSERKRAEPMDEIDRRKGDRIQKSNGHRSEVQRDCTCYYLFTALTAPRNLNDPPAERLMKTRVMCVCVCV
jgi:hypothetical protein